MILIFGENIVVGNYSSGFKGNGYRLEHPWQFPYFSHNSWKYTEPLNKGNKCTSSGKIEFSKASKVPKILHQQSPMNKLKPCKYSKYSEIRRKFKCCIHRTFKWCIAFNQPSSKYSISNMHICLKLNACYFKKISPYFAYMLYWGGGCICDV